jgi:hypothetical protein
VAVTAVITETMMRKGKEEICTWIWIAARLGKRNVRDGEEVANRIGTTGTTGRGEEGRRRAIN